MSYLLLLDAPARSDPITHVEGISDRVSPADLADFRSARAAVCRALDSLRLPPLTTKFDFVLLAPDLLRSSTAALIPVGRSIALL